MQHIVLLGVNYKSSDVSSREKLSEERLYDTIYKKYYPILCEEFIILATCNRFEVICTTKHIDKTIENFKKLFQGLQVYSYQDKRVVEHLYRVACGIDSMVFGEYEILSQIKRAYQLSQERKTVGPILHHLLQEAIRVGKKIRHQTQIGMGITSVAHAAILLAKKNIDNISKSNVLVIGAGIMAERSLRHLKQEGISHITIINRTYEKAYKLAKIYGGIAKRFRDLETAVLQADIILSATSSQEIILPFQTIQTVIQKRPLQSLHIIDIALPRDIDPKVEGLANVYLYNVDDVQQVVETNVQNRKKESKKIRLLIKEEVDLFFDRMVTRKIGFLLRDIQKYADEIREEELQKVLQKLTHLNDHEKNSIVAFSKRVESKFLNKPFQNIKRLSRKENGQEHLATIREVFDIVTQS